MLLDKQRASLDTKSMQKYAVEGIGTFFLVLTIAFSANPLAIGVMLAAMIYMGGYISGAHYNPAVTLAVFLQKKIEGQVAFFYVLAQLSGAIAASIIYKLISANTFAVAPSIGYTFPHWLGAEILFTFALASVVLHTAVSKKNTPNQFYGLAIGLTVMAGAFSVGTISGGAFNPAVGVGPALADLANLSQTASHILLYVLGPCIGAALASLAYSYTTQEK